MSNEPLRLTWRALLLAALLATGCTDDHDSLTCFEDCHFPQDPAAPFVVVPFPGDSWCTPHELAACDGDDAILCNAAGTDHVVTPCDHGCSEELGGCNPPPAASPPRPR